MKDVVAEAKALVERLLDAADDRSMCGTSGDRSCVMAGQMDDAARIIRNLLSIVERLRDEGLIGLSADGKVVVEGDTLYWPDGSERKFWHVADINGRRFRAMPKQGEMLGELVSANNAYSTPAAAEAAGGEA